MNRIIFDKTSTDITKILRDSKILSLMTQIRFFIFRNLGENNMPIPPIKVSYKPSLQISNLSENIDILNDFFMTNKIWAVFNRSPRIVPLIPYGILTSRIQMAIGLREDLTKHILLSGALLQTIIYTVENKLSLTGTEIIPQLPLGLTKPTM